MGAELTSDPDQIEPTSPMPSNRLNRAMLLTIATSGLTLALNLGSGILTARALEPSGRGLFAAISVWMVTAALVASLGIGEGMTFLIARCRAENGAILGSTLLMLPFLSLLGVALGELIAGPVFSSQGPEAVRLVRLSLLTTPVFVFSTVLTLLVAAHQRFRPYNALRLLQPLLFTLGLAVLLVTRHVSVPSAVATFVASFALTGLASLVLVLRYDGLRSPRIWIVREGLNFGLRLQGAALASTAQVKLDVMVLPAFVVAAQIGYYSVAVGVASMVVVLFGEMSKVIFPVASRSSQADRLQLMERVTSQVLAATIVAVICLGAAGSFLIQLVYGRAYAPSYVPLLLLLPGITAWTANSVLQSGLLSSNRPGVVSIAQVIGLGVTVVGLAVALPTLGINGAAIVSSLSYASTFAVVLWIYRKEGFSIRSMLDLKTHVTALIPARRQTPAPSEP